ncbi:hypothetical protein F5880DRAFT_1614713 [Lentinula raphanica]|nr:hypothetical protein F5880DRAFT_1614713 [Lentinula raphanica]
MDNPWANAWDESQSSNPSSDAPTKSLFSSSSWKDPTENETDIALPSWSAGPAVTWNEPSDDAPTLWAASASNQSSSATATPTLNPKVTRWTSSYESMSAHFGGSSSSVDEHSEREEEVTEEAEEVLTESEEMVEEEEVHEITTTIHEPEEVDDDDENHEANRTSSEVIDPWTPAQSTFTTSTSLNSILSKSTSNSPKPPVSPDAFEFGTFESGVSDSSVQDGISVPDAEWGSAWGTKESESNDGEAEEEVLDEWERARREKEKLDRAVPPELLASILHTLEQISDELWPPAPQIESKDVDKKPPTDASQKISKEESKSDSSESNAQTQTSDDEKQERDVIELVNTPEPKQYDDQTDRKDESQSEELPHWRSGIDAVEGLSELSQTIAPPLPPFSSLPALPSQSNYSHSSILKRSSEAIRLTRSTVLSSSGPFGLYLKTKGSIEWEVTVKARPEKTSEQEREEIVPAGWRILPKETEDKKENKVEPPEMKKRGSSILSSFFGRKTENAPAESRSRSMSSNAKDDSPRPSFASSRHSVESTTSKTQSLKAESPSSTKLPTNPVSAPAPASTFPSSSASTTTTTTTPSTYGDGGSPDLFQDAPTTAPAPSAVSRFFNRFSSSRNRPSHSRQNSNASLALSTDDLEFLEDIVPSASDDVSHDIDHDGLQQMINSAPLPKPLVPPPRASPQPQSSSQTQSSSPRSPVPSDDLGFGSDKNSLPLSDAASRFNKNLNVSLAPSQILTPSPALPSQIQTVIAQGSRQNSQVSRSSTPSSFASPLSSTRSESPGLDLNMLAGVSGSSLTAGGRGSPLMGAGMNALGGTTGFNASSRTPSSILSNTRTSSSSSSSSTTMKRPTPVAIMSSSSNSSPKANSFNTVNSFGFLPPPPSIRGSRTTTPTPSLLIDDEPLVSHVSSTTTSMSASALVPPDQHDEDDDFSDFLSATTADATQPPFSPSFSLSSAQPLFSAGSAAFEDFDSSHSLANALNPPEQPFDNPLNTSLSSIASTKSTNSMLLASGDFDSFGSFPDASRDFASTSSVVRDTLRTPSPPALPAKSPGKIAARKAFGMEPLGSGVARRASTGGKKNMGGSGVGGRIPPGRLNLPPPVSSSAYSRNWGSETQSQGLPSSIQTGSTIDSASPFIASSSEPALGSINNASTNHDGNSQVAHASSSSPTPSPKAKTHQKRVSKEAHQRTRSLVEDAMARSGIWPSNAASAVSSTGYGSESGYGAYGFGTAPPLSPLPPILSPPPESSSSSKMKAKGKRGGDLLMGGHDEGEIGVDDDDDDVPLASLASGSTHGSATNSALNSSFGSMFASQQGKAETVPASTLSLAMTPSLYTATSSHLNGNGTISLLQPSDPAPSRTQTLLMDFSSFGSSSGSTQGLNAELKSPEKPGHSTFSAPPLMPAFNDVSTDPGSKKPTGGLSAQDLSFFEGL